MPAISEGLRILLVLFDVFDRVDVPVCLSDRRVDHGQIAHFFFQQRPRHRRVDRDVILTSENFIVTDNAELQGIAVVIFDFYPGAEENFSLLLGE